MPRLLRWIGASLAVLLVSGSTLAVFALWQFQQGIEVVDIGGGEVPAPSVGAYPGGFNVLLVGSDTRVGQGGIAGEDPGSTLNDVNMLLHVSADHTRAVAVSIPRDTIVPLPECTDEATGETRGALSAGPINTTLARGGLPCVVLTVEELTGLDIQFAGVVTFTGVIEMSNAVGGVPVCITAPIDDPRSGLHLPTAGEHVLSGAQALAFLRTRYGVGDGSDLGRISSQQVFLSSLVRVLKSSETLENPARLYELARATRDNMLLSSSMAPIDTLVALALALKDIPLDEVVFVQYPTVYLEYGTYIGRLAPDEETASALMAALAADQPFELGEQDDRVGAVDSPEETAAPEPAPDPSADPSAPVEEPDPSGTPAPEVPVIEGLPGQTAADQTCSVANE